MMRRSEAIEANRAAIAEYMVSHYETVMKCHGRIQYSLYLWEDGELEGLEQPQGDCSWLGPRYGEKRKLFFVTTIRGFNPWDIVDHSVPEDEAQKEEEEQDVIADLVVDYRLGIEDLIDSIIREAQTKEVCGEYYAAWQRSWKKGE